MSVLRFLEEALANYAGCALNTCLDRRYVDSICTHIMAFVENEATISLAFRGYPCNTSKMVYYGWVIDTELLNLLLEACEVPGLYSDVKYAGGRGDNDEVYYLLGGFISVEQAEELTKTYLDLFKKLRAARGLPPPGGAKFRYFWKGLPERLEAIRSREAVYPSGEIAGSSIAEAVFTEFAALLDAEAGESRLRLERGRYWLYDDQLGVKLHSGPSSVEEYRDFGVGRIADFYYWVPKDKGLKIQVPQAMLREFERPGAEQMAVLLQQAIDQGKTFIGHLSNEDVEFE